jgi:hypothetical protein
MAAGDGVRSFKSVSGVAGALIPVLYCGGLLYYFLDVAGSVQEAEEIGLGPTVLGLGAVGLLFSIPLILKVLRLFRGPRSGGNTPRDNGHDDGDDDGGFDADAAISRYMARRATEAAAAATPAPAPRPAPKSGGPAGRPSSAARADPKPEPPAKAPASV